MTTRLRSWWKNSDVGHAILLVLIARAVAGLVAWAVVSFFPGYPEHAVWAGQRPDMHGLTGILLAPFERDDSVYYLSIAHNGYFRVGLTAFFPLYPMLIRAVGTMLLGNYLLAAILISTASYATALVVLRRLVRDFFDDTKARLIVTTFALWPVSWYFLMPLTESLFLALTLGCFLALRRARFGLAGFLGILAALTRLQGVLLAVPIAVVAWRSAPTNARWARLPFAVAPPAATALFYLYIARVAGYSGGFTAGEAGWAQHVAPPWQILADSVRAAMQTSQGEEWINLFSVAAALGCLWWIRRLGPEYVLYVAASLALILVKEGGTTPLISAVRFIAVLFPIQIVVAERVCGLQLSRRAALAVFALTQLALLATAVRFVWIG